MSECLDRLARLRERLPEAGLDGIVVSSLPNLFYLTGFRGSSGAALITEARALLFSDFRYRLQAAEQAPDFEFVEIPRKLLARVGEAARREGLAKLGYDPGHLTCSLRDQLAEGAEGLALLPANGLIEDLRAIKSPAEIGRMSAAAALADAALEHMTSLLRVGATEREIALEGEFFMRRQGAEAAAFDLILASGPRSALPHAETTDRALQPGDLVVIDMGARIDGYCSDMTRTYAVRRASEEAQALYRIVYQAQRAAAAEVRPGAPCGDLDRRARSIIEEAGYGDHFGHGLGHGVGVEVHEAPRLAKDERPVLAPGNVVTVEPGIYLEGRGGIRLEDMLVVTPDGADNLTGSPMPSDLPVL